MTTTAQTEAREYYRELAKNENIFAQMGKRGYSMSNFFRSVRDITDVLDFQKTDIFLDAAGGAGWYSIALSPLVRQIYLFDYTPELIQLAQENIQPFDNIIAYVDDVTTFNETRQVLKNDFKRELYVDKIFVGGVIQHLPKVEMIESMFLNVFKTLKENGKALFTQVPDLRKREAHFASYDRLDWPKEEIEKNKQAYLKQKWHEIESISKLAKSVGFRYCTETPIHKTIWQSTNMFNFILIK
jgi:cyclopropane fatty-acyl-phospholipid synthase-like methyltransferase